MKTYLRMLRAASKHSDPDIRFGAHAAQVGLLSFGLIGTGVLLIAPTFIGRMAVRGSWANIGYRPEGSWNTLLFAHFPSLEIMQSLGYWALASAIPIWAVLLIFNKRLAETMRRTHDDPVLAAIRDASPEKTSGRNVPVSGIVALVLIAAAALFALAVSRKASELDDKNVAWGVGEFIRKQHPEAAYRPISFTPTEKNHAYFTLIGKPARSIEHRYTLDPHTTRIRELSETYHVVATDSGLTVIADAELTERIVHALAGSISPKAQDELFNRVLPKSPPRDSAASTGPLAPAPPEAAPDLHP